MGEIIEARDRFAPRGEDEFESGETVAPGIYVDIRTNTVITMRETDVLPDEVRVVRLPRRFRRVAEAADAGEFPAKRRTA